ncbi:MAG: replicative DNA helicase [Phycisphaerales bacterium]|nr:replicative DNA helicase [Phycisphaerales bacterium]
MSTFGTNGNSNGLSPSHGSNGKGRGGPPKRFREVNIELGKLFDKLPPHSPEAEMALLGAMILDPKVTGEVLSVVKSADAFYVAAHGAIYESLVQLYDRHQAGNLVMLGESLRDKEVLTDVGGPDYLMKLARETPAVAAAPHFARIVAQKYKLRQLIAAAGQIAYDAYHAGELGPDGAGEILDGAEEMIFKIAEESQDSDPERLEALLQIEYERLLERDEHAVSGIRTGYTDLDELTSGLQNGELIIVAARPSMGKTALALNLAEQIAMGGTPYGHKHGEPQAVGFFSLEMSKSAIAQRLLSSYSGISSHEMRSGRLAQHKLDSAQRACDKLREAQIYIDDTPGLTVLGLRTRARRMKQQYKLKCLFVDYPQLMTAPNAARESRQVEVSAISRGVKALARELDIPIICLSQLNRGPETRGDNRPRMSDLRESGSIEQDADVVALLHREEYYHVGDSNWANDPENEEKIGVAEIIIAKQRNGPTDVVKLTWDRDTTRFKNSTRHARGDGGYAGGGGGGGGYGGGGYGAPPAPANPMRQAGPSSSHQRQGGGGAFGDPASRPPASGGAPGPGGFTSGKKTGPVNNFRDGGGPAKWEENDEGAPF